MTERYEYRDGQFHPVESKMLNAVGGNITPKGAIAGILILSALIYLTIELGK